MSNDSFSFDGNPRHYQHFKFQLTMHLHAKLDKYDTILKQIAFLATKLQGRALTWLNQVFLSYDFTNSTFDAVLSLMDSQFTNHNATQEANDMVSRASQKPGQTASAYSDWFRQAAAHSNFGEAAKMYHYQQGLRAAVKNALAASFNEPTDLETLITWSIRLDQRIPRESHQSRSARQPTSTSNQSFPTTAPPVTRTAAPTPQPSTDSSSSYHARMFEQRQHRRENNLCAYCGSAEHAVDTCPVLKAKPHRPHKRSKNA